MENEYDIEEKDYKVKEQLYSLYFELSSEIKGKKIEIEEDEYAEKVSTTPIEQIIKYIKDSIQILYSKIIKEQKKPVNPKEFEVCQYEKLLRKYEQQRRDDIKNIFSSRLQKEAYEFKLEEYMEIEDEFEEMKEFNRFFVFFYNTKKGGKSTLCFLLNYLFFRINFHVIEKLNY